MDVLLFATAGAWILQALHLLQELGLLEPTTAFCAHTLLPTVVRRNWSLAQTLGVLFRSACFSWSSSKGAGGRCLFSMGIVESEWPDTVGSRDSKQCQMDTKHSYAGKPSVVKVMQTNRENPPSISYSDTSSWDWSIGWFLLMKFTHNLSSIPSHIINTFLPTS